MGTPSVQFPPSSRSLLLWVNEAYYLFPHSSQSDTYTAPSREFKQYHSQPRGRDSGRRSFPAALDRGESCTRCTSPRGSRFARRCKGVSRGGSVERRKSHGWDWIQRGTGLTYPWHRARCIRPVAPCSSTETGCARYLRRLAACNWLAPGQNLRRRSQGHLGVGDRSKGSTTLAVSPPPGPTRDARGRASEPRRRRAGTLRPFRSLRRLATTDGFVDCIGGYEREQSSRQRGRAAIHRSPI